MATIKNRVNTTATNAALVQMRDEIKETKHDLTVHISGMCKKNHIPDEEAAQLKDLVERLEFVTAAYAQLNRPKPWWKKFLRLS